MSQTIALSQYEIERNKPMPNRIHGLIQGEIMFNLKKNYGEEYHFISEMSLDTNPSTTPDICIYPRKKLSLINIEAKEKDAPITTIEIQSPSQSIDELNNKAWNIYFPMGVQSAWIVIPAIKSIQIFLPNGKKKVFTEGVLKDPVTHFELDLEKVFVDVE